MRGSHVVLFNFDVGVERNFDFRSKHLSVKCGKSFETFLVALSSVHVQS